MIKIKYLSTEEYYSVEFERINNHVVKMMGDVPENNSGFLTYLDDNTQIGDFSSYKTTYRIEKDGISYSNDGSTYVEPTKEVTITIIWVGDTADKRPSSVKVNTSLGNYVLTEWTKRITTKISNELVIYDADDISNYKKQINGWNVIYEYSSDEPTWEEKTDAQLLYTALMTDTLIETDE